jgi:hypothetical protein
VRPTAFAGRLGSPEALLFALAVPLVFLHARYQPEWTLGVGSTGVTLTLSDLAVLAAGALGLRAGIRRGFAPLRAALPVLAAGAALLAWILAATIYPLAWERHYRFAVHLVTWGKFAEYALLALAPPLLLRRRRDAYALFAALTAWSVAASAGAVLQFLGLVNEFEGRRPGQREPSFLGIHDLAALSGAVLCLALAAIALGGRGRGERRVAWIAGISGAVGLTLSGAVAGALGLAAAAGAAALVAWRRRTLTLVRLAALGAIVLVVGLGVLALRSADISSGLRFVGIEPAKQSQSYAGASYAQRSVLAYLGWRMWLGHPLLGVGWQGASEQENYGPYLPDARRRFPRAPAYSLPSPRHPWGIQNGYVQAAAELGAIGFLVFAGFFAAGLAVAARAALRVDEALVPVLWLLVTMGIWLGLGIVAGIPLVGLQWLALGLAAAAPSWARA